MKTTNRKALTKKLLVLWSTVVRESASHKCEWCGKPATQAHHMIAKAQGNTLKFSTENGVALCCACHMKFHNRDSSDGWVLFKEQRPYSYEFVQERKHQLTKLSIDDLRGIEADLLSQLEALND